MCKLKFYSDEEKPLGLKLYSDRPDLPTRLRALDLDYYRLVVKTQNDPEILKTELSDLIDEIAAELEKEG